MKHGTKSDKGCNLGKKCSDFHPKMCPTSITKLECYDTKCNLCHVKNTKRKRDIPQKSKPPEEAALQKPDASTDQCQKESTGAQCESSNEASSLQQSFLDQINLLRKELQEVVDKKIHSLFQTTNPPVKMIQPHAPFHPQFPPHVFQPYMSPQQQTMMFQHPLNQMAFSQMPHFNHQQF